MNDEMHISEGFTNKNCLFFSVSQAHVFMVELFHFKCQQFKQNMHLVSGHFRVNNTLILNDSFIYFYIIRRRFICIGYIT